MFPDVSKVHAAFFCRDKVAPEDHYNIFFPNTGIHSHNDTSYIPEDMNPQ